MDIVLMLELYQAFENAKQQFIDAGVPPIETIDRYRGQPLNPEQYEYFGLPAIFIGRNMQWLREGNVYNGTLSLDFHIVAEPTGETSNIATNKEEGLKYLTLLKQIRKVLDNFRSERVSTLERSIDREVDTGVITYDVISYSCIYYDDELRDYGEGQIDEVEIEPARIVRILKA